MILADLRFRYGHIVVMCDFNICSFEFEKITAVDVLRILESVMMKSVDNNGLTLDMITSMRH